jgi:hypothetical protein
MDASENAAPGEEQGTDAARGADAEHEGDEAPWVDERDASDIDPDAA